MWLDYNLFGVLRVAKFLNEDTGEEFQEPDFVKVYIGNLCRVKGLSGLQADMFNFMLRQMNEYNEVGYGTATKRRFITDKNICNQTFNNNIKHLIEAQLIERMAKGEYRVNKKYAVKVAWSMVQKITWTTEYSKCGTVEKVEIL